MNKLSNIDNIVLNTLRSHKFSSSGFVSRMTNIHESEVEESMKKLESRHLIFQSTFGFPKRFSLVEDRKQRWM